MDNATLRRIPGNSWNWSFQEREQTNFLAGADGRAVREVHAAGEEGILGEGAEFEASVGQQVLRVGSGRRSEGEQRNQEEPAVHGCRKDSGRKGAQSQASRAGPPVGVRKLLCAL